MTATRSPSGWTAVTYRVTDALTAVMAVDDVKQALREAQLALRETIGTRELDVLLAEKDGISRVLVERVSAKARDFGVAVTGLGIRDVVLPGEMKDLLNKVTEARKASEAALITRREETAAMRMQANTAKLLEGNPTLSAARAGGFEGREGQAQRRASARDSRGYRGRIVRPAGGRRPVGLVT
jgi:regulator of protease activity HflC (stomatin/prohibitin superfamily)